MATHCEIHIASEGAQYVATTPHVPDLKGSGNDVHLAINDLIGRIRGYCESHESRGEPVPWVDSAATTKTKDVIVKTLIGIKPASTVIPHDSDDTREPLNQENSHVSD